MTPLNALNAKRSRVSLPKVLLVEPYWEFWESSVDFDLRADRAALAAAVREALDVEWAQREQAEVALVLQTMATPPAWTLPQIEGLPVVVWAAHRPGGLAEGSDPGASGGEGFDHGASGGERFDHGASGGERFDHGAIGGERFDHGAITSEGATVGAPMLTSVLVREGRPFELILGRIGDRAVEAQVERAIGAAAAASRLRKARIGRVGRPLEGYACVDTDDELLRRATGIELVPIDPAEVREAYLAAPSSRVKELREEAIALFDVQLEGDELERSLRAACAIERLVERHELDAGAMNCHVPEIRFGEEIGITPCMGLGRSTSIGVPWTCVGDVLTAVAMLASTLLGGGAQYHELEAVDYETSELVIASSGEYDLSLAPGAPRPRLIRNGWFASDARAGACACFSIAAGPGTLVGFAQVGDRYRLIAAEGQFSGRCFEQTGTANGGFRFEQGLAGWTAWCRSGANHHSAATQGRLGASIEMLARFLGIESVLVAQLDP